MSGMPAVEYGTEGTVESAYSNRAQEYISALGSIEAMDPADREHIAGWARPIQGRVIDAGCGPGHWTKHLVDHGAEAEGIDLVPAFIEQATNRFPGIPFQVGSFSRLSVPDGYASGVLAWYSLIHIQPDQIPPILLELRRVLAPGGTLLLGFFESAHFQEFAHAVTPAYSWPVEEMSGLLTEAGFEVLAHEKRTSAGHRPHASITARRTFDAIALNVSGAGNLRPVIGGP